MLYPLKFKPIYKDKIWGGQRIKTLLGKDFSPLPNCGESWEISGVEDNVSVVAEGFLEGNELNELIEVYMGDLVGDKVYEKFGAEFPILVKFIDSSEWLSVQVHPDDELAKKRHGAYGKSEMWYVFDAAEDAQIITGFSRDTSKEEFAEFLKNKRLKELLNFEKVENGDVFYTPAGRIHALGPGILLAEIQQTSDITYRVYDWDRVDASGKSREMHTELALDAIDYKSYPEYKTNYNRNRKGAETLVNCSHFTTNLLNVHERQIREYNHLDSFVIYVCVDGTCYIAAESHDTTLKKGECLLIPASIEKTEIYTKKGVKLLETYINL